jgi:D-threo-aldose 1-dehydrogenase
MARGWATRRELGATGLAVTGICVGTSPLAGIPRIYGYGVEQDRAVATVRAVFGGPFNFMDTSNSYGGGDGERRIGKAIREAGGLPAGFVLATKADADKQTRDFSGARVRRSVEESLERLGLDRVQLMYLHDPEYYMTVPEAMAPGGPVEALVKLREEGVLASLGIAAGPVGMLREFVATGVFQVVLSHNRYTLIDRSAEPLLEDAKKRNVAFVNAAPYGGGILVKGPDAQVNYAYKPAAEPIRAAVLAMQRACAAHDVPLAAAALQFSLREPRIASTVVGFTDPARIAETIRLAELPIPEALWDELLALAPSPENWLN